MQAHPHVCIILDNHLDSGDFIGLNFQKLGTSEDFPGGWVPAANIGTSEEILGTSEVCTTRNTGMFVALGVCVKAWNFSSSSHVLQLVLTSRMAKHLIDLQFASHLNLHKLNWNAPLESDYKHHMERGAYLYNKVLRQAKCTKPRPWAQDTT
jgi:hypothetical protein